VKATRLEIFDKLIFSIIVAATARLWPSWGIEIHHFAQLGKDVTAKRVFSWMVARASRLLCNPNKIVIWPSKVYIDLELGARVPRHDD
jgi:hypothetical protein